MLLPVERAVGQHLLLAFDGKRLPAQVREAVQKYGPGGFTLFRSLNLDDPAQVRELTGALQEAARNAGLPPLLIALDQEGGQLMAVGQGVTQLPGNMALGATGSADLAQRAGQVLGYELAAMGVNINYAPSCDVNINPQNPVIGVRSFGEDPGEVGRLGAALVQGIQSAGVAATAKHFPGHGDTSGDSHHGLPSLAHSLERLRQVELPPFQAAIQAGVKLIMTAHLAIPALDGPEAPPATLSSSVLTGLLRGELGFEGVIITDAMDMGAIRQGEALVEESIRAIKAGADLLLLTSDPADYRNVYDGLLSAARAGAFDAARLRESLARILALKHWLGGQAPPPGPDVIGCAVHRAVADEIAERSITLVRDRDGLLPVELASSQKIAVVIPRPVDLTPADTSSYVLPALAQSIRNYHSAVDEYVLPHAPQEQDIAALLPRLAQYGLVVVGTLNAFQEPAQAVLVREALKANPRTIVVAMRLPYDLAAFLEAPAYVCTYSILEPSMRALSAAMFGRKDFFGRLPVTIPA